MSWHGLVEGNAYSKDYVVSLCMKRIHSGEIQAVKEKIRRVKRIAECNCLQMVYRPQKTKKGFGNSPLNENNWRKPDGAAIRPRATISR